ncbi:GNAT family N-acetyltransferase [Candidatus Pelagibacter sp.]|jgi:putative acetyltransferase|nr:GNAT family N-acetyltransferase [Candidatus Pelagibacter sp.]|tara:strand:- start:68 stop:535 length:468 start_codon:yes stop_codon:yes gene_type:complete
MLKSIEGNFDNLEVYEFLIKHFIELRSASPEGSAHVLDIAGLKDPSIKFWSLWEESNLMGSGALKFLDKEHGEFKSIRVSDKYRNKGNGSKVINHLINEAKKLNIKRLSLETGSGEFFMPARKLFIKCGFKVCEPFSHYKDDINSVYMSMLINNN